MNELRTEMERARREAPAEDEALERLVGRRDRSRRNGRVLSAVVALGVTGAMVVGGVAVLSHRGGSGPAGGGGGTSGAVTAPNLVAGDGQFYYWKYAVVFPGGTATMTYWWSPDGTGRMVNTTTGDGYSVYPDGPLAVGDGPVGDDLSGLSTDPAVLLGQLRERSGPDGGSPRPDASPQPGQTVETGRLVSAVEDLLNEQAPHSSPTLRVALYEVLRGLPTVQDLGSVEDPTGRAATGLRVRVEASLKTFFFDPKSHLFLAEEHAIAPDALATLSGDTSTSYTIVEDGGIVDSLDERPSADQAFFPVAERLPEATGSGPQPEATVKP